ncbi:MAG: polyamine aminopropyltransferase [Candidatus Micrarchaeia archaeon]
MEKYFFQEGDEAKKGRGMRIEIEKVIEDYNSKFQRVRIMQTKGFGKMLVLDDAVMLTEFDNFAYHEMIAHVPIFAHPNPKKVLVIGGGDGGTISEIVKHKKIEEIHLCEIDEEVIEVGKRHFPEVSQGLNDKRVKIYTEDGAKFIKENKNYDIIIVDSSDPVGPAEILFQRQFYSDINDALNEDGILVTQSESMYYHQDIIERTGKELQDLFPIYKYYFALVPTYPSGVIGFSFCSKKYDPINNFDSKKIGSIEGLKYYNKEIHIGSFGIPNFLKKKIY